MYPRNLFYLTSEDRPHRFPKLTDIDDDKFSINLMWAMETIL